MAHASIGLRMLLGLAFLVAATFYSIGDRPTLGTAGLHAPPHAIDSTARDDDAVVVPARATQRTATRPSDT